ncbi:MAG: HNH endonuclease [Nitrososphaeraceae archaeon]
MLRNNIYNIDREFNYATVKSIVVKSLEKIANEEALKKRANMPQNVIFDFKDNDYYPNNVKLSAPPTSPLLKLKIRNTTNYLSWRLAILKRDKFTCQICHTSMKDNKSLRLEVHHAKAFNDICKENNVRTVKEALACKELWKLNNGFSICYNCHKDVEKLRTKLRNMFLPPRIRSPILLLM